MGLPWRAQNSIATNIGFVSKHLRGVDLQHYRAPLLTAGSHRINDWSFDPAHSRKFALCSGGLHFYDIQEEAQTPHQLLSPVHTVPNAASTEFLQFQYNPVVSCMLMTDSRNSVLIYDMEAMTFASKPSGAKDLLPLDANRGNRRRERLPSLVKSVWNSDFTTIFASYNNGDCLLLDPRSQNTIILSQALHQRNRSGKAVTFLPLTHQQFFLSSGHYGGCLEIKLWDRRNTTQSIQTIDMGSTSSPACMVTDDDCRHLFANARGDRILRHFSLYDSETHAPQLVLNDSHFGRSNIRQLAIVPKTQWQHHKKELAQILKSDGTTIETLHVFDNPSENEPSIYTARTAPRSLHQSGKLSLSLSSSQNSTISASTSTNTTTLQPPIIEQPTATTTSSSLRSSSSLVKSSASINRSQCCQCGTPIAAGNSNSNGNSINSSPSPSLNSSRSGTPSATATAFDLPEPSHFSSAPEYFDPQLLLNCTDFLAGATIPERKRIAITPWGELTHDLANEFLKSDFSDFSLQLPASSSSSSSSSSSYPLHKCILSVRSPYWKKRLDADVSLVSTTFDDIINGVSISPFVLERTLFFIYTDTLPISAVRNNAEEVGAIADAWGLFQLSRWIEAWRKNPDTAHYFSFYHHQLMLLKTKPDSYFSDLTFIPGAPPAYTTTTVATTGGDGDLSSAPSLSSSSSTLQQMMIAPVMCSQCQVSPRPFKCHKLMAGCRNAFIRRMLSSGMKESQSGVITLDLLPGPALRAFVAYLYSNVIEAEDPNDIMELWSAAEAYFMPNLVEACEMALRPLIDFDNCIALYERAGKSTTYLRTYLANYISVRYSFLDTEMKSYLDPEFRHDLESNFTPVKSTIVIYHGDHGTK